MMAETESLERPSVLETEGWMWVTAFADKDGA